MALATGERRLPQPRARHGLFIQGEAELRARPWRPTTSSPHAFADDVVLDMIVPHGRVVTTGSRRTRDESLRAEAPGRRLEVWNSPSRPPTGFVVEYAYRTLDDADSLAVGRSWSPRCTRARSQRLFHHLRRQLGRRDPARRSARRPASPREPRMPPSACQPMTTDDGIEDTGAVMRAAVRGAARVARAGDGAPRVAARASTPPWPAAHRRRAGARGRHRRALRPRVARAAGHQRPGRAWSSRATPTPVATPHQPSRRPRSATRTRPRTPRSMALLLGGVGQVLPRLPEAYRTGTGISFGGYGDDVRLGQGLFNRGAFLGQLTQEWVPAMPDVAALLSRRGAAAARPRLRRRAGRASRSPRRTRASRCSGSTATTRRSWTRGPTPPRPRRRPTGSASRWPTPTPPLGEAATTWPSTSRRCTTWRTRSRRWPRSASVPAARRGGRGGRRAGGGGVRARRLRDRAAPRGVQRACTACPSGARSRTRRRPARCSGPRPMRSLRRPGRATPRRGRPDRARPVPVLRADAVAAGPQTSNVHLTGCVPGLVFASRWLPRLSVTAVPIFTT